MDDQPHSDEDIGPTAPSSHSTVAPQVNPSPAPKPESEQQFTNTANKIEEPMSAFERATLRWTRAMFIVTAATGLFISLQWLEMKSGGLQTDKIIAADERLARAMEDSVAQAQKTLNATIEQAHLDQRAWLAFEDVTGSVSASHPGFFAFNLKNTGKSPAVNVYMRYFVKGILKGERLEFTYKGITTIPSRDVIPPNGIRHALMGQPQPEYRGNESVQKRRENGLFLRGSHL